MTDPLDTEAAILAAAAYVLDRRLAFDVGGVPLGLDDQRRVLSIAYRALLRVPLPPAPHPADTRELPTWLLRLAPDPQQES